MRGVTFTRAEGRGPAISSRGVREQTEHLSVLDRIRVRAMQQTLDRCSSNRVMNSSIRSIWQCGDVRGADPELVERHAQAFALDLVVLVGIDRLAARSELVVNRLHADGSPSSGQPFLVRYR
jgi:hypothetical protein